MPLFMLPLGAAGVVVVAFADASPFILSVPVACALPAAKASAGTNRPASNFILNGCRIDFSFAVKGRSRSLRVPDWHYDPQQAIVRAARGVLHRASHEMAV